MAFSHPQFGTIPQPERRSKVDRVRASKRGFCYDIANKTQDAGATINRTDRENPIRIELVLNADSLIG